MASSSKRRVSRKNRIKTIQLLVNNRLSMAPAICSTIDGELNQVVQVERIPDLARRTLLQVLHATRAMDSALKAYLAMRGCKVDRNSLGGYLTSLTKPSVPGMRKLRESQKARYQQNIVEVRNRYMHEAGAFPNTETQITQLLGEMEACLSEVLSL